MNTIERTLHPDHSSSASGSEVAQMLSARVTLAPGSCPSMIALAKQGVTDPQELLAAEITDLVDGSMNR